MGRKGRKPEGTGHVERLSGSEVAKQRLTTILETLAGKITVPEACARLGIREARFHAPAERGHSIFCGGGLDAMSS
jgi:hypothetical protein